MASAATRYRKRPNGKPNTVARRKGITSSPPSTDNGTDSNSVNGIADKPKRKAHPNSLKNLRLWQPGQSGNPRGPLAGAKNPAAAAATLREAAPKAAMTLLQAMEATDAPWSTRVTAAQDVLDRVLGKAIQTSVNVSAGGPEALESLTSQGLASLVIQQLEALGAGREDAVAFLGLGDQTIIDVTPGAPDAASDLLHVASGDDDGDGGERAT